MLSWLSARWREGMLVVTPVLITTAFLAGGVMAETPPGGKSAARNQTGETILLANGTRIDVPPGASQVDQVQMVVGLADNADVAHRPRLREFIEKVATRLGVSPEQLTTAMKEAAKEMVDEAVAAGRVSQEVGDRLKERIDAGHLPPGFHASPLERHGPRGAIVRHIARADLPALASWLGITPQQLREELRQGRSLAQVAEAHGKTRQELTEVIIQHTEAHLARAVEQGRLTQEEADAALADARQQVDRLVDRVFRFPVRDRASDNGLESLPSPGTSGPTL